jgi:hypothetical protein
MSELDPRLMETLARLERRITDLEARPEPAAAGPAAAEVEQAVWWPALDHGQAAAAWDELGEWVRELLTRYSHHAWTVRPCWRQHPEIVDELTALRVVWLDAYANPAARPTAAADFLTRWLPGAMTRIEAAFGRSRCRTEAGKNVHADDDTRWAVPDWTDQQVADFIEADLDGRPR